MPVIGIVGGIGSGKSTLARGLRPLHRVLVIDGDRTGHAVLEQKPVQDRIRRYFGNSVFTSDGHVDRHLLAGRVFGSSPAQRAARSKLESILHPVIRREFINKIETAKTDGSVDVILLDAAVLLEADWRGPCDAVVFIDVPRPQRLERIQQQRGWTEEDLARREASQFPVHRKRQLANFVIDNSQSTGSALAQLDQVVKSIQAGHTDSRKQ